VKALVAATDPAAWATVEALQKALEERLDTAHLIGLSLILDVLHMAGREGRYCVVRPTLLRIGYGECSSLCPRPPS
jgi:hypothetical protein